MVYRGLLLSRDPRVGDGDARWRLAVSDPQCEITRSAELRPEIDRDIRNTLHDLVATLEEARATMGFQLGPPGPRPARRGLSRGRRHGRAPAAMKPPSTGIAAPVR